MSNIKNILVLIPMDELHKFRLEKEDNSVNFIYKESSTVILKDIEIADIIIGNPPIDMLKYAKNLKWLQLNSAGANEFTKEGVLPDGVLLTNATGAYGLAIAEHMIGMLLGILKKLHIYRDNQSQNLWKDEGRVKSIYNSTVLIVGIGDIGSEFAKIIKAMGGHTIGVKRRQSSKPEFVDELYLIDKLEELLPKADVVALCLPSTKETNKLFDKEKLSTMKQGSVLINIGRGTSVDTDALCDALESNHLLGACLDVVDPEPLPKEHKIWNMDNVIITPHVSGGYHLEETYERIFNISADNLNRFINGEKLNNIVDFTTGYKKG